jgi:phytoene synthase
MSLATPAVPDPAAGLARLRTETIRALAGDAVSDPVFVAFQRVARECDFPARYPLELLAGFEMDVTDRRYDSLDEILLYCYRVAGVVGVMMALVMGARDKRALQRAADLGIAFQLTNISRDVLDDARNGRCYLPAEWLAEAGIPADGVARPEHREALAAVVDRLLTEADRYYRSAGEGLRALNFRSAWAVATALGVYRDIGRVVRRLGPRGRDERAVVSTARKLVLLARGGWLALMACTVGRLQPAAPRDDDLWTAPEQDSCEVAPAIGEQPASAPADARTA